MDEVKSSPALSSFMKSPEQGCATSIWAATARELERKGGVYCEDCGVAGPTPANPAEPRTAPGYASHAFNSEGEEQLWKASLAMVGLKEVE